MNKRIFYVLHNERGASSLEVVIWISIIVVICSILLVFGRRVKDFLSSSVKATQTSSTTLENYTGGTSGIVLPN